MAYQIEILRGASRGRGNDSLFTRSWSHDQDGRHKIFFPRADGPISTKLGLWHRGLQPIIVFFFSNDGPMMTLPFYDKANFGNIGFLKLLQPETLKLLDADN